MSEVLLAVYGELRWVHVSAVVLSGLGFALRGAWMLTDSPRRAARWVRVAPHGVDTVLLLSALGLMSASAQYPFVFDWLTAKVLALLAYIGCGMVALREGRPKWLKGAFFLLALGCYAFIVSVALRRDPAGFFGVMSLG